MVEEEAAQKAAKMQEMARMDLIVKIFCYFENSQMFSGLTPWHSVLTLQNWCLESLHLISEGLSKDLLKGSFASKISTKLKIKWCSAKIVEI